VSEIVEPLAQWCAAIIETLGIGIITATAVYTLVYAAVQSRKLIETANVFYHVRQRLGRGILLGLRSRTTCPTSK